MIIEIDDTIHKRFFKAYNEIDKNFNQMCRETLNNSEGKLLINNSEDFDNCGVEIFVKFGNKKRQTLSSIRWRKIYGCNSFYNGYLYVQT